MPCEGSECGPRPQPCFRNVSNTRKGKPQGPGGKVSQLRMNEKRSECSLDLVSFALHVHDPLFQTKHWNYDLRHLIMVIGKTRRHILAVESVELNRQKPAANSSISSPKDTPARETNRIGEARIANLGPTYKG